MRSATRASWNLAWLVAWALPFLLAACRRAAPEQTSIPASDPRGLAAVAGKVFFTAFDRIHGRELWVSDGTPSGSRLVRDVTTGHQSSTLSALTDVGGILFFVAGNETRGFDLWRSDGTAEGTRLVKAAGPVFTASEDLAVAKDRLFFVGSDGTPPMHNLEMEKFPRVQLWTSDGSPGGTSRLLHGSFRPSNLIESNGILYLHAGEPSCSGLFKTDGTVRGTVCVRRFPRYSTGAELLIANPENLAAVGRGIFFAAEEARWGSELWRSDGTEAGTVQVADLRPGPVGSAPGELTDVGGLLFFTADDGVSGRELWRSDGSDSGTWRVKDIAPGSASSNPHALTPVGQVLYFVAWNDETGFELWRSDGKEAGTRLLKDIRPGRGSSNPTQLVELNGRLVFAANDGVAGRELWGSDGTPSGTSLLKDMAPGPRGSDPSDFVVSEGRVYLAADDSAYGRELWVSNGTSLGTARVPLVTTGRLPEKPEIALKLRPLRVEERGYPEDKRPRQHLRVPVLENRGTCPVMVVGLHEMSLEPGQTQPQGDSFGSTQIEIPPGGERDLNAMGLGPYDIDRLHYFLLAVLYGDSFDATTNETRVFVIKWPGTAGGQVPTALELASPEETARVQKEAEAMIGRSWWR